MAIADRKRGRLEEGFGDVGQIQKRQKVGLGRKEKLCRSCSEILEDLTNHHLGKLLQKLPVDSADLPDYLHQIWRPMDLGTVKTKVDKDLYYNCERFAADVRLIFFNATRYYPLGTCVFAAANRLSKFFEEKWKESREKLFDSPKQGKRTKDEDFSTLVHYAIQRSCASVTENLSAAKALRIEALKVRFSNTIYSRANKKLTGSIPQSQKREKKVMEMEKCVLFEDHLQDLKQPQ